MEHSGIVQTEPAAATPAEAALLKRARMRDEAAWTQLVEEHQEPVFRLAYLMLGAQATVTDAEDVAQETFVRAYVKLEQFDDGRPLRPWLLAIAANLARNRRRSRGRYWAALQRWWTRAGESDAIEPAAAHGADIDARRQANQLWKAVQHLSADHRQAVYLRYFLDLSEEEMAAAMNVAPGTVKSRLYRARQALRKLIEAEFPELHEEWNRD